MDTSPHKSDFVNANGIRLHYLDWGGGPIGGGPVLLFLAGLGCNAHIFDRFAPRFTDKFHVLGLTRRGHGESDYPQSDYDVDTLTEDIRLFLDAQHIDRAILVGHSMAGMEIVHFAVQHPERVLKLVILDGAYERGSELLKTAREKFPIKDMVPPDENGVYDNYDDMAAHLKRVYPLFETIWDAAMDEQYRHQVKPGPDGKFIYKSSEAIDNACMQTLREYAPEDAKISVPVLNIYAFDDDYRMSNDFNEEQRAQVREWYQTYQMAWNRHCIEQFRRDVPHANIVEIAHSNHYLFIRSEEQVFAEMRAFLLEA